MRYKRFPRYYLYIMLQLAPAHVAWVLNVPALIVGLAVLVAPNLVLRTWHPGTGG